jgi:hypothetical protein
VLESDIVARLNQFGVSVGVRRRTAAQDLQRPIRGGFDAMRRPWWDADGIVRLHLEDPIAQGHAAAAGGDMVEFFGVMVSV